MIKESQVTDRTTPIARSKSEVTNMRPAKEFPAARKHFGETSTFKHFFPRLVFAMRYQKLSP